MPKFYSIDVWKAHPQIKTQFFTNVWNNLLWAHLDILSKLRCLLLSLISVDVHYIFWAHNLKFWARKYVFCMQTAHNAGTIGRRRSEYIIARSNQWHQYNSTRAERWETVRCRIQMQNTTGLKTVSNLIDDHETQTKDAHKEDKQQKAEFSTAGWALTLGKPRGKLANS